MAYDYGLKRLPDLSGKDRERVKDVEIKLLAGNRTKENPVPEWTADKDAEPFVIFKNPLTGEKFGINRYHLARGVLLVGAAGSGKTNVNDILVSRILSTMTEKDISLVNDTKGEYYEEHRHRLLPKNTYVVGNGAAYRDITRYWNAFGELMDRGEDGSFLYTQESDEDAMELAAQLFTALESKTQPAFPEMSGQILGALFIYFMRKYWKTKQSMLNNREFRCFVLKLDSEKLKEILEDPLLEDRGYMKIYIFGGKTGNQSQGVLSFLFALMEKVINGPFAQADPVREFSVRELFQKEEKAVVFLEMDFRRSKKMAHLYALLMNQLMKYTIGGREKIRREVSLIIDEWSSLKAPLDYMDSFLAQGRSLGAKLVCSLQTIESLETIYKEEAKEILALFQTCIGFRVTGCDSLEFLADRTGKNYENRSFTARNEPVNVQREGHSMEEWDLRKMKLGEAVVVMPEEDSFLFQFPKYEDWKQEEQRC